MSDADRTTSTVPYISSIPEHVRWGTLPLREDAPVATLDSGALVDIDTVSHEGLLEDQGSDPLAFFGAQGVPPEGVLPDAIAIARRLQRPDGFGPHVITGPIAVLGAQPGDYLAIDIVRLRPRVPYGVVSNRHGRGVLPDLPRNGATVSVFARQISHDGMLFGQMELSGPDAIDRYARRVPGTRMLAGERGDGLDGNGDETIAREGNSDSDGIARSDDPGVVTFPLAPFLGIAGVTPESRTRLSTVPPADFGGNIDINLLVEGTRLYLPIFISGAGFYIGDPHFSQGNGEVALTAFEASLSARVRLTVIPHEDFVGRYGALEGPLAETPEYLVPTGRSERLDDALEHCTQEAIRVLVTRYGMDEAHAYAYLSAATDFDISEAVDIQRGVHACIRKADFE
ncbi:acetamidase/formamidase family protein [Bifidobacterium mongoliense]|uniref:acetamidase/formamidase family protein n=1 Tax=Bifidobacterium mongoliense TaxID=518643 RepID=UPI0030EE1459